jgi:hypothetical protein
LLLVTGACSPRHASTGKDRADCPINWSVAPMRIDTVRSTEGGIVGSIVDARTGAPIDVAFVRLGSSTGTSDSVLASDGRFEFAPLVTGTYEMRTIRIGYHPRRDTLRLQSAEALNLTLPMDVAPSDECHGLEVVTRKSWWRFW